MKKKVFEISYDFDIFNMIIGYITKFISYNEYYPQILVNSSIPHIKNSGNIQVYITVVKLSVKY